jgi:dimethylsulfide dehydrogenase subunit gamma/complex iron-sulfur molybdoenzyme family reductase subunit gamma
MGDAKSTVNIWYWRADGRVEELIAGGFGTATSLRTEGEVAGVGARTPKGWQVVLTRKLTGPKEGVNLKRFREIPVAFAAWDGANQERDGFKAVTLEWWRLKL